MKKNKFSLYFIFISVLTFLTVFVFIVQKSYFNLKNPQKSVEENQELTNFNPNLDLSVLSLIESRDKNTNESFDFSVVKSGQAPTAIPTPYPITKSDKLIQNPTPIPTIESEPTEEPIEESVEEFIEETEEITPVEELNESTL